MRQLRVSYLSPSPNLPLDISLSLNLALDLSLIVLWQALSAFVLVSFCLLLIPAFSCAAMARQHVTQHACTHLCARSIFLLWTRLT